MTDAEKVTLLRKALEDIREETHTKYFPCKKEEKLLSWSRIQALAASALRKTDDGSSTPQ